MNSPALTGAPEPGVVQAGGVVRLAEGSVAMHGEAVVDEQLGLEDPPAGPIAVAAVDAQEHALRARADLLEPLDL